MGKGTVWNTLEIWDLNEDMKDDIKEVYQIAPWLREAWKWRDESSWIYISAAGSRRWAEKRRGEWWLVMRDTYSIGKSRR